MYSLIDSLFLLPTIRGEDYLGIAVIILNLFHKGWKKGWNFKMIGIKKGLKNNLNPLILS